MIDSLCKDIVMHLNVNRIVETGTDKGETVAEASRWFAEMVPGFGSIVATVKTGSRSYHSWNEPIVYPVFAQARKVRYEIYSVDIDRYSYRKAAELFKSNPNIHLYHASSEEFLNSLLPEEMSNHNYLFFLDAHWGKYWPLRAEIKAIRKLKRYLVVVDDFFVPGRSDPSSPHGPFGFDVHRGQILDWAYICDLFTDTRVKVFYPTRPNRDRRGWVLIAHGYREEKLSCLRSLALFEIDQFDAKHTTPVKMAWHSYWDRRNILKEVIPIPLLRSAHRAYEKVMKHSSALLMWTK